MHNIIVWFAVNVLKNKNYFTVSSSVIETIAGVILSPASLARTSIFPSSCKKTKTHKH